MFISFPSNSCAHCVWPDLQHDRFHELIAAPGCASNSFKNWKKPSQLWQSSHLQFQKDRNTSWTKKNPFSVPTRWLSFPRLPQLMKDRAAMYGPLQACQARGIGPHVLLALESNLWKHWVETNILVDFSWSQQNNSAKNQTDQMVVFVVMQPLLRTTWMIVAAVGQRIRTLTSCY